MRALSEMTQTHETHVWINDKEYAATVLYADDGSYVFKPYPDVAITGCIFKANKWTDVDLCDEAYSWLMTDEQKHSLIDEINEKLINEFWERDAEAKHVRRVE
jgi:hypothetical protein